MIGYVHIFKGDFMKKKKIPCRICGKLFEPCASCQSKTDFFTWRSFACSRKCAVKYINQTIQYRNTQHNKSISSNYSTDKQEKATYSKKTITGNSIENNTIVKEIKKRKKKIEKNPNL